MHRFRILCSVLLGLGLSGCQHYISLPLNTKTVGQALTPPSQAALRIQAQELKHPILKPVKLDESGVLTPDSAAVLAVLVNPSLRAVRDQRGLADAQLLQAGLLPNPQVSFDFSTPSFGSTTDAVSAYGIGLNWDVSRLVDRAARMKAAGMQHAAVDLDIAWQEWQVAEAAKSAVYRLVALESQVRLSTEIEQRFRENLDLVRRVVRDGHMTVLDLAAAQTASTQAHAALLDLHKQASQQWLELKRSIGLSADAPIRLQPAIELPSRLDPPPASQLLKDLEQRRLDLVALHRGYESQEETVRAEILAQFPKINIGVNRQSDTSDVGTIGFGVAIDLPLFDRNQGAIRRESATRQKLFDEYVNRVFEARTEIARLLDNVRALNEQIQNTAAAHAGLELLVNTYRTAVGSGQADVLSYYTAWNNLTQNEIDLLSLKQELIQTSVALELASGLYRLDAQAAPYAAGATPMKER